MPQKKQSKGTGNIAFGAAGTAYGVAGAPVLRNGSKDMTRMVGASPKKEGKSYQAELHQAMQSGKVSSDSPVHVLRTPSGRHINAGGTHRQIAREAMGKPSEYKVKDISHEIHVSPIQRVQSHLRVAGLKSGSKQVEAGKQVKPVSYDARAKNNVLGAHADVADRRIWEHPSAIKAPVALGRKAGLISAGVVAGTGALTAGVGLHQRHKWNQSHPVAKSEKPLMSEAEQRRRQKLQGKIGRTTSTLGLAGVGLAGAGALAAKKPGMLKNIPKLKNADPEKLKNAAFNTGIVSGGIGGVGGFNQASIYSAEARRRKAAPVKKSDSDMEMGYYGEEGHARTHEEIENEISKAWEPVSSKFSAESKRSKRNQTAQHVLTAGSGAAGVGAGAVGVKAALIEKPNWSQGQRKARHLPNVKAAQGVRRLKAVKTGKVAAGLAGASLAAGGAAALVDHKRKGSWQPYSKRDQTSAFGVDHSDDPNGQHRETEN